jgi:hypothetical protein
VPLLVHKAVGRLREHEARAKCRQIVTIHVDDHLSNAAHFHDQRQQEQAENGKLLVSKTYIQKKREFKGGHIKKTIGLLVVVP